MRSEETWFQHTWCRRCRSPDARLVEWRREDGTPFWEGFCPARAYVWRQEEATVSDPEQQVLLVALHGGMVVARLACGHLAQLAPGLWVAGRRTMGCGTCRRETVEWLRELWARPEPRPEPHTLPSLHLALVAMQGLDWRRIGFARWLADRGRIGEWPASGDGIRDSGLGIGDSGPEFRAPNAECREP